MEPYNYAEKFPIDTPKEVRNRHDIGDIFVNSLQCPSCNHVIISYNRHDFKFCSCGKVSVDGGSWYQHCSWNPEEPFPIDLCQLYNDAKEKKEERKSKIKKPSLETNN